MKCVPICINTISSLVGIKAIPALMSLQPERNDVVLDVPSYSQTDDYSCGAIAAFSIIETFHPGVDFAKVYNLVGVTEEEGVGIRRVLAALHKFKVGTHCRTNIKWEDIKKAIDDGFPMLIGTGMEDDSREGDHWSVLYGYGQHYRKVYIGNCIGLLRSQERVGWGAFLEHWWNPRGKAIVCWGL